MSGVFKALGTVSGIVSSVLAFVPGMQPLAAAFAANAAIMGTLSAVTAKKPLPIGSSNNITIGANQPAPYLIGRCYYGGNRELQIGYGEEDKIPNAHAAMVDVYSVGGPLHAFVGAYADFNLVSFAGDNAIGYYHNNLHFFYQLGATPEFSALAPHWTGLPDWGPTYKISGKAAGMWNARFPKKGEVFRSGFPQTGTIWEGVLTYDPRQDSSYPGGSGPHRWASPADTLAFTAAKATWGYDQNPGTHGLRYALGTWELAPDGYLLTFGMGLPYDGVVVEDFVEFANVCDANGWKINGMIFEPGDRWENLKNICAAGAAEPCMKGGRLGLRISAPKVSLDTITAADLADGDLIVPATRTYRERLNTIIPKFKSSDHRWEYVPSSPVKVLDYVTADGEERSEERQYNLVAGSTEAADQVAQLAAYELVDGRERFPIEIVCKPRLRHYSAGDQITVDIPEAGLVDQDCVIMRRSFDPSTMTVSFTLREETAAKHAFALSQTGTSPPAISILPPGEIDGVANGEVPEGPEPGDWALAGTTLTQSGADIPALLIAGGVGTGNARDILVDVRKVAILLNEDGTPILTEDGGALKIEGDPGPWIDDTILPETVTQRVISNGILPGAAYQVGIRYRVGTAIGERLILGPVLSGSLGVPRGAHLIRSQTVPYPLSSNDTSISIMDFVATLDDSRTVIMPAGSITGLASATSFGVFWSLVTNSYTATEAPSLAEWASSDNVFLRWQSTSAGGVYVPGDPPPPGDGGDGNDCVTDDTLIMVAEGMERPARELVAGDMVWTQHERTLEWGMYPIAAISFVTDTVWHAEGYPRATARHRFLIGNRWIKMDEIGQPDGTATVAKITVGEAHTYVSAGVLSHNIKG